MNELVDGDRLPDLRTIIEIHADGIGEPEFSGVSQLKRCHRCEHLRDRCHFVLRIGGERNTFVDVGVSVSFSEDDSVAFGDEHGSGEVAHIGANGEILVGFCRDVSGLSAREARRCD
jgi:hypothetical protein